MDTLKRKYHHEKMLRFFYSFDCDLPKCICKSVFIDGELPIPVQGADFDLYSFLQCKTILYTTESTSQQGMCSKRPCRIPSQLFFCTSMEAAFPCGNGRHLDETNHLNTFLSVLNKMTSVKILLQQVSHICLTWQHHLV